MKMQYKSILEPIIITNLTPINFIWISMKTHASSSDLMLWFDFGTLDYTHCNE